MPGSKVVNVVVAGLGGQGVVLASDLLARAAFLAGRDVKKSEIHGMSQRGGSVAADVRYGERVLSPMVPPGEADFLLVLAPDQVERSRPALRPGGVLIEPSQTDGVKPPHPKSLNVVLLGLLSRGLDIPEESWRKALAETLPARILEVNLAAFELGRSLAEREKATP